MAERNEAPTPQRLSDARERGQSARSMEVNAAIGMLVGAWLLLGPGKTLAETLTNLMRTAFSGKMVRSVDFIWLKDLVLTNLLALFGPMAEIVLVLMFVGIAVTLAQTRTIWPSKRPRFDFSRVNPINGFKRLFSMQGIVELVKALLKLGVVGYVAYSVLSGNIFSMLQLAQMDLRSGVSQWVGLASNLVLSVAGAYIVVGIADFLYQRFQFLKSMKMTRQEVTEELKRSEGDPLLRGRIRQQQRRIARMRMMSKVPQADVVITNPTHLALAMYYDTKSMKAPMLVAKGAYQIAERIVEIARENEIPVIQNVPLARAIYKIVEVDEEIPSELYVAMAEVLAYVYRMKKQSLTWVTA